MKKRKKPKSTGFPWETKNGISVRQDHHIIPRSRNGDRNDNILQAIPSDLHYAYHRLFGNLVPQEVLQVLLIYLFKPGKFRGWRKIIDERNPPFKLLKPDQIISLLVLRVFPHDWVPEDKLMRELEKRRNQGKS